MAAEVLAEGGVSVTVYECKPSPARKFLLAGRGGLNLTHTEPLEDFTARYRPQNKTLNAAITNYPQADLIAWCQSLGQTTFVGSSGRVFPKAMKASPLLRAWLRKLAGLGVVLKTRHRWTGWNSDNALQFETPVGVFHDTPMITILALGGASWPHLGADGSWVSNLAQTGVAISPFRPSNCGFHVAWSDVIRNQFAGKPLKRIALGIAGDQARGEIMITRQGIEGGAVYALSGLIRDAIDATGSARITIDMRPDITLAGLAERLSAPRKKQSVATFLKRTIRLTPAHISLLHEAAMADSTPLKAKTAQELATLIKGVPLTLTGTTDIARAISSAGGIKWTEIDEHFMLPNKPGTFVAGEMLDWEAPTGGYLLHACFATGRTAARDALNWAKLNTKT